VRRRAVLAAAFASALAVTVGSAAGAPARRPVGTGFATHVGPAYTLRAGEPSIGVSWRTGAVFLQASTRTAKAMFDGAGTPTWTDVTSSTTGFLTLDPVAASDNATGRVFVSQLIGFGSLMAYSDDDGASWSMSQGSGIPAGADHQTVGAGPYPPEGSAGPGTTYPHAVYYCSQELGTALCARSDTGGLTFGTGVPAYTPLTCGGLHGHVKVGPDGVVYLPNKSCNGAQGVVTSHDAGVTWAVTTVPGTTPGHDGDPSVAVGRDGTAYVAMADGSGRALVSVVSGKGGWSAPVDVGAQVGVVNASLPSAVAGDDDRAAVAFLGTRTPGSSQDEFFGMDRARVAYTGGEYHLYVATTLDRGRTWKTVDVTPKDPVQRGRICSAGVYCSANDRNLLDFLDIQVDRDGRVLVGWADGCVLACVTSPLVASNTYAREGRITRQTGGTLLFRRPQRALSR
jgi:hypothetical protein